MVHDARIMAQVAQKRIPPRKPYKTAYSFTLLDWNSSSLMIK